MTTDQKKPGRYPSNNISYIRSLLVSGETLFDAPTQTPCARVAEDCQILVNNQIHADIITAAQASMGVLFPMGLGAALRYWLARSPAGHLQPLLVRQAKRLAVPSTPNQCSTPLQRYLIDCGFGGSIGMAMCPGLRAQTINGEYIYQDLSSDIKQMKEWGISCVVSAIEPHEFLHFGLPDSIRQVLEEEGIRHLLLPIQRSNALPRCMDLLWQKISQLITSHLRRQQHVLVHSGADMGRAGYILARFLIDQGHAPDTSVESVRALAPYSIDSFAQEFDLHQIAPTLTKTQ